MKDVEYPFWFEIDYWPAPKKTQRMREWFKDMQIPCTQIERSFFFKTDEDRLMFVLRWG